MPTVAHYRNLLSVETQTIRIVTAIPAYIITTIHRKYTITAYTKNVDSHVPTNTIIFVNIKP